MAKYSPTATKIMLLRHAEKPDRDGAPFGVTLRGERSKESLQVRGWQRAGALISLLAPANGHINESSLAQPQFLYASKPLRRKGSKRPLETITPLAEKLGLKINQNFTRGDFDKMLENAFMRKGVVLICWQREYIPRIALHILGQTKSVPRDWPEDRFDLFWVFDLDRKSGRYKFKQVPQSLLEGDLRIPIK
jgi:hypothetical protein